MAQSAQAEPARAPADIIEAIRCSAEIAADFAALTGCGGRLVGSDSERAARALLETRLAAIPGVEPGGHEFTYRRWACASCTLERTAPGPAEPFACHPLIWSGETPSDGIEAAVIDLGRGAPDDFRAAGGRVRGRFALVRHEYPFARTTIHRRIKYALALEHGAAGFIIANPMREAGLVTGSCGRDEPDNIPGIGVGFDTAEALAQDGARVRLRLANTRCDAVAKNLIAEVPGQGPGWVVVSAHYDGHDLADSALDNATGVVAALEILRRFARHVRTLPRGLRVMLFTAEESALLGSRIYADALDEDARRAITAVINLDTLAGSEHFTCLTSGFADLDDFVAGTSLGLATHRPLMRNSDHFNFVRRGIPALRLIAGFDDPDAGARHLLTSADSAGRVRESELRLGAVVAAELAWAALKAEAPVARHMSAEETARLLAQTG